MNVSKIASQVATKAKKVVQPLAKPANKLADSIGEVVDKSEIAKKVVDAYEPNGGDNQFFGLASIMVFAVLIPRILTALKRNPENKEATKDEIVGIVRRDVTTILTMLFALKSMNTLAGNIATKVSGIPMVNKTYQKLFDDNAKTFGQKALSAAKSIYKGFKDTINPIGGSKLLNGEQIIDKYTGYQGLKETQQFLKAIPESGGDAKRVYSKIHGSITDKLQKQIKKLETEGIALNGKYSNAIEEDLTRNKTLLNYYRELDYDKFMQLDASEKQMPQSAEDELTKFFNDKANPIAKSANAVKVWLQTAALSIETFFLGFGLPAINQKALEKKYLSEKPIGTVHNGSFNQINDRHIKAQEIKLYSQFIQ